MEKFFDGIWPIPHDNREKKYASPTYRYVWGVDKVFLNVIELAKKIEAPHIILSNANINQELLMSIIS